MIKSVIKFFGTARNANGMPDPYFSYLVVASPWQDNGSGIATIISLSESSVLSIANPATVNPHHVELSGGEKAAYDKAVGALKVASLHAGLSFHEHLG